MVSGIEMCICTSRRYIGICDEIRKGVHVNCDVIKMVEVLFVGQVNGSSRNVENKFLRALHTIPSVLLKMRFYLGKYVNLTFCEENFVCTSLKYSDNSK